MKKQLGFSVVEGVLVVVTLAIVGAVGFLAYNNFGAPKDSGSAQSTKTNNDVKVESKEDLSKVDKSLDDVLLEDSDSTQIDSAAETF